MKRRGFTLVEFMVVAAFVLILLAIIWPAIAWKTAPAETKTITVTGKHVEYGAYGMESSYRHKEFFLETTEGDLKADEELYRRSVPGVYRARIKRDHVLSVSLPTER